MLLRKERVDHVTRDSMVLNELERALTGDSAAAPADRILQELIEGVVHRRVPGAPHTIYEELWHLAFWQEMTLDWVGGIETPYPVHASMGFPEETDREREGWEELCERFLRGAHAAAAITNDEGRLQQTVRCPSQPEQPVRTMTVRGQLESLAAHNAYHLGRVVLLRQLLGVWPPAGGGFSW